MFLGLKEEATSAGPPGELCALDWGRQACFFRSFSSKLS